MSLPRLIGAIVEKYPSMHLTDLFSKQTFVKCEENNYLIFKLKEKKMNPNITIKINEQLIDHVKNTKILGVCIDEQLS